MGKIQRNPGDLCEQEREFIQCYIHVLSRARQLSASFSPPDDNNCPRVVMLTSILCILKLI